MKKNILHEYLISDQNINYLVDRIYDIISVKKDSIIKHKEIIKKFLSDYVPKVNKLPDNTDELAYAVSYLNGLLIDDFCNYLQNKVPNRNIYRKKNTTDETIQQTQNVKTNESSNTNIDNYSVTILSNEEFREIIKTKEIIETNILDYVINLFTNPIFIDFIKFIQYLSPEIIEGEIIDEKQFFEIIGFNNNKENKIIGFNDNKENNSENKIIGFNDNKENNSENKIIVVDDELMDEYSDLTMVDLDNEKLDPHRFLDHVINTDLQNKLLTFVKKAEDMKCHDLVIRTKEYIKKMSGIIISAHKESTNTLNTITEELSKFPIVFKKTSEVNDMDYFRLEYDPSLGHYLDPKNRIKFSDLVRQDRKVSLIGINEYYLPSNNNNVMRTNCGISLVVGDKKIVHTISIGKYIIDEIIGKINEIIPEINLSLTGENVIIKSNNGKNIELIVDSNSIFTSFGFIKDKRYKGKNEYISEHSHIFDKKQNRVNFCLSGIMQKEVSLELDNVVIKNSELIVLKKSDIGIRTDKFDPLFTIENDIIYDFNEKITIEFIVKYK